MKESLRLIRPFLRGIPLIVLSVILAVLIAKKYLTYVTPNYESTVKIKLADLTQGIPNNNLFKDLDVFASSNKIAAEIELMKSTVLLEKSMQRLSFYQELYRVGGIRKQELYNDAPIIINTHNFSSYLDEPIQISVNEDDSYELFLTSSERLVKGTMGDTAYINKSTVIINRNHKLLAQKNIDIKGEYEFTLLSKEKLIEKIKKNLDVIPADKDVPVISIIYKSAIPQKSADFVNNLAQVYIEDYIESKFKAAETTVGFLDDRINEVSSNLSRSENRIETYKNGKGIVDLRQESETDLRKIAQLKIQLSNIKISLDAMQELEDNLRSDNKDFLLKAPNFQTYTDLLSTELIKKVKALQAERRDLLLTFTPKDERVKVIDAKLDDLIVYLIEGVTNSKRNQKTKYEQLRLEIAEAQSVFEGFATKQKDLTVMNRDFNIYESSYNFLNEKRIEAEIARAAKISFHRIISPAVPSKNPVSPNRVIIIIVSGLLALIGSIALIYIVHAAKGKVNDIETIESQCAIPVAIKTPFLVEQQKMSQHFLKEAIQLELKGFTENGSRICVSSKTNKEGRQLHTIELAKAFQKQGRKVKVLDFQDILEPIEASTTKMDNQLYRSMSKGDLDNVITQMSCGYDIVLIDNEEMQNEQIGLLLMSLASHNLYVIDSRETPANHIQEVDLIREEFNIPKLSFVMNKDLYNPSVIKEIIKLVLNVKNRLIQLKRHSYA
ncbi:MAG: hypothetical protein KJP21_02260 [Bacteroidia bacterium]|nr:hypothetical protein [Bacteroidia bacterium]NNJ55669.1 hypothetical protein [Bacteroidia bacterium]